MWWLLFQDPIGLNNVARASMNPLGVLFWLGVGGMALLVFVSMFGKGPK